MAQRTAAEALVERLRDWGVDTVLGLPGDGINGMMEGLRRHQDKIRFVLVHHQEAAAFMAADPPALVDVSVNPDEPPMPGQVHSEQAKGFVKAFLAGQPRKATIASTLFRDRITEPRR
jgi:hypothetical protein